MGYWLDWERKSLVLAPCVDNLSYQYNCYITEDSQFHLQERNRRNEPLRTWTTMLAGSAPAGMQV